MKISDIIVEGDILPFVLGKYPARITSIERSRPAKVIPFKKPNYMLNVGDVVRFNGKIATIERFDRKTNEFTIMYPNDRVNYVDMYDTRLEPYNPQTDDKRLKTPN